MSPKTLLSYKTPAEGRLRELTSQFTTARPTDAHVPPPGCTPRPLVPRSRADLYEAAPLLYGTPTFDVCFYSCSRRKERSQTKSTTRSDPHSLPQCIAASGHVSHATLPNPSRARGESAQNPCKKHAAKAKLAANRTDRAAAFQNSSSSTETPARATLAAPRKQLRAATCCMARAPRVAARALEVLQ